MATENTHWDVGAYVLGVLGPAETEAFEAHLAGCDACADEVESLLPVTGLLTAIDPATALAAHATQSRPSIPPATSRPPQPAPRRGMAGVRALHRRVPSLPRHGLRGPATPAQRRLVAAAVLVPVAALSFLAGSWWGGGGGVTASADPSASVSAPHALAGATRRIEATDASSGVHAIISVAPASWGSQVQVSVGGVRGPLRCDLVAIGADGKSTVVASWIVHEPGYGIPEEPELLTIDGATALTMSDTRRFEIRELGPVGPIRTLVTVLV